MPIRHKLYIDSEGVKRGYYVYLHKDRATGQVFYVGKGHGRRAWETQRRNDAWKDRVASLSDGWDVEVVREDLSEIEAFELEEELVETHGGAAGGGGKLTNWVPGGESPASIKIELPFDDGGWSTAYYAARQFKSVSRKDQKAIAASVCADLEPLVAQLSDFEDEADESDDDKLFDSASNVESIIGGLLETASHLMRRRVSWKDFGIATEEAVDDLEAEMEDADEYHPSVIRLLEQALVATKPIFRKIDSGNRQAAEELANKTAREK